jgi:gag-polyprotein putative aspartyl protease
VEITEATKLTTPGLTRRAFLLLLGAISLCCLTAHAQEPLAHKVPFTLKDNMIWIQAKVNGYPATLKIDSGATTSVIAAKFQTVHNSKEIEVRTAGGMVKASLGDARVEIGDLKFQLTATYLRDFIDQGVIGIDVLGQFARVVIDFQAKEIEFVPFGQVEANATH